jgi:hypothetical protein
MLGTGAEPVRLFWTAGFDSTFRLLELAGQGRAVQPYYVIDRERRSYPVELDRMALIRGLVLERYPGARVAPLRIGLRDDLRIDPDITGAWEAIARQTHVGAQYAWLAQFCRDAGFGDGAVEVCMTRSEPPTPLQGAVFEDVHAPVLRLRAGAAQVLFRHYAWPTRHLRKAEMRDRAVAEGFWPILQQSWFCHAPVNGAPCGRCAPCRIARAERDDVVLPRRSRVRDALRRARSRLGWPRTRTGPARPRT